MNYEGEVIVWCDLETSGLNSVEHEIVQIAAIATKSHSLEIIEQFECKLQFSIHRASKQALERNSYEEDIWETAAVPQNTAFRMFDNFLQKYKTWERTSYKSGEGRIYHVAELGGHNLGFDNKFLRQFYGNNGNAWFPASAWRGGYIDTLDIAKTIQVMSGEHWEDGFRLSVLCERFNVELVNEHDALADVKATIELYKKLRDVIILDNRAYEELAELPVTTESINDR